MQPSDLDGYRPCGSLVAMEPARPDGFYSGIYLQYAEALYPVLGRVLVLPLVVREAIAVDDVVVFRPLTYTEVDLDEARSFAVIEESVLLAVLDGYNDFEAGAPTIIRPLGDRVVCEVLEEPDVSLGGVFLPDRTHRAPQRGRVIAAGPGAFLPSGRRGPMTVRASNEIVYRKAAASELRIDGCTYAIVSEREVFGICDPGVDCTVSGERGIVTVQALA